VITTLFPSKQYTAEFIDLQPDLLAKNQSATKYDGLNKKKIDANYLMSMGCSKQEASDLMACLKSTIGSTNNIKRIIKLDCISKNTKRKIQHYLSSFPSDSFKRKKLTAPVELNTADSETIVALYRIGPSLTHRILEYRRKLGGFVSLKQLNEIWGFDEDILYDLKDQIFVNPKAVHYFNLNTVTAEELSTHPYFKYKLSNAIVNYRMQHGHYKHLEDLKSIHIINDSIYQRVIKYLYLQKHQ
jgi:DNA uptake protein ComE-like DNA-binding protein